MTQNKKGLVQTVKKRSFQCVIFFFPFEFPSFSLISPAEKRSKSQTEAKIIKRCFVHSDTWLTLGTHHRHLGGATPHASWSEMTPSTYSSLFHPHTHLHTRTHAWIHEYTVSKSHPLSVKGVRVITVHDQQRADSTNGRTRTLKCLLFYHSQSSSVPQSVSMSLYLSFCVWCACTPVFTVRKPSQRSGGWGPRAGEHRPRESSLVVWECWWLLWWSGCSGSSEVLARLRACSDWSG